MVEQNRKQHIECSGKGQDKMTKAETGNKTQRNNYPN